MGLNLILVVRHSVNLSVIILFPLSILFCMISRIVAHHFSHICISIMALDLRQNFAQYLENKLTEFHQILYTRMHSY